MSVHPFFKLETRTRFPLLVLLIALASCSGGGETEVNDSDPAEDVSDSSDDISDQTDIQPAVVDSKVTYISDFSFFNRAVRYAERNGFAFMGGDMVLGTVSEVEAWTDSFQDVAPNSNSFTPQSVIRTGLRYRWIDNTIPYQFHTNVSAGTEAIFKEAVDHWESNTIMKFVERTSSNETEYPDYVLVVSDERACWSYVGRIGGPQKLNIIMACGFGGAVHEIGHAVGLWHEQSREDRDQFVTIHFENIRAGAEHNFNKHISNGDDVGPYDYDSIMHYGPLAFSKNRLPTISPLQPANIGQRDGLSVHDVLAISQFPLFEPLAKLKSSFGSYLGNHVFLDASRSYDPNGGELDFRWDLGDGTVLPTGEPSIVYTYQNRGRYTLQLTVTDPDGLSSSVSSRISVYGVEVLVPMLLM